MGQGLTIVLRWYTLMYIMLTQDQAQKMALEQQTTVDNILKEHYQMFLLDILFNAPFENQLIFKGGTALRLAYGSTRFSEDLDFSLLGEVGFSDFNQVVRKMKKAIEEKCAEGEVEVGCGEDWVRGEGRRKRDESRLASAD